MKTRASRLRLGWAAVLAVTLFGTYRTGSQATVSQAPPPQNLGPRLERGDQTLYAVL